MFFLGLQMNVLNISKSNWIKIGVFFGFLAIAITDANAATTGLEFKGLYDMLLGWAEGYLGKALAIGAFLIGSLIGFARATAMPALIGIVFAIVFSVGPGIISGMMTAVI